MKKQLFTLCLSFLMFVPLISYAKVLNSAEDIELMGSLPDYAFYSLTKSADAYIDGTDLGVSFNVSLPDLTIEVMDGATTVVSVDVDATVQKTVNLDLSSLPKGTYTLSITNNANGNNMYGTFQIK